MTTFTMGLGIDGTLGYAVDYETGGSADYNEILEGTKNWPDPITNTTDPRIDDLWHAAVNGRGQYFSASRPDEVVEQIDTAIASITAETGAGSGAATSALEPTQGDNYAYTASYRTQFWNGDLQAKEIYLKDDPLTSVVEKPGELRETPTWSAAYKLGSQATRTLYTFDASVVGTDKKRVLSWATLSGTEKTYFAVTSLFQCNPVTNCPGATDENLFNFLMGGADTTTNTSYRNRESVGDLTNPSNPAVPNILGDLVNSQPVFVGKPNLFYTENGYTTFKNGSAASRGRTVYVGSNDGFLHAFNADTGVERWAYMAQVHLPALYKQAGTDYAHQFYQDGTISVTDAHDGTNWRTILVSGMNRGGKYYLGLDVTDPATPKALWEFTDATTSGFSYGNPIITKLPTGSTDSGGNDIAGRWVVLLTSGYNNTAGNGQGVLYVLDVFTGQKLFEMTTTSSFATAATPIGLAKINAWADDPISDNTAKFVYGGDLNGDLWRFDPATKAVLKVAALGEPVTVRPALGDIDGARVLFLGTGLFLQEADKSDASQRSIFAIKDTGATQTNLKTNGSYVQQVLTNMGTAGAEYRIVTNNPVDWLTKNGWYINLPDARERVNLDPRLVLGTLVIPSNVPDPTSVNACSAGGYSWKNVLDWKTGSAVATAAKDASGNRIAGTKDESLLVGFAVIVVDQDVRFIGTTADNKIKPEDVPVSGSGSTAIRRISWREIVTD
jgi:type IV pilus assembly protein PilY1